MPVSEPFEKLSCSLAKLHDEIDKRREEHDAAVAQRRADRAAAEATEAIDFAPHPERAEESLYDVADPLAIADAII